MGDLTQDPDCSEFVEVDPTGRYGRYNEILGKGASKTVYRAFDEYEGIEVAWNQVKLNDFLQSPEELERLYCEIHLLKTLKHKNIMKFYTSWVDTSKRNINFVTEMFTSGTLRQYRQKHRRVNIRAVKHWCRQILKGLLYLHGLDPPVIHRDLKCDNIFVNGNQGEVKIGDLGLAAILRNSHAAHCVGTPEFMAPEIYEEQYNELADIYSFGMCILEMVTFEYPYSECTHPAQIYKKVVSGMKPDALYKVQDPEVRYFVEKCLATVSQRLPARELLKDPFLQIDGISPSSREDCFDELGYLVRQPSISPHNSNGYSISNELSDCFHPDMENEWDDDGIDAEAHGIALFDGVEDDAVSNMDITIKGRRKEDGRIFFRLRIADKDRKDRKRNIYFLFNTETDTALSVATEMVEELDIIDYEVTNIAEMIDGEVSLLVPDWNPGPGIEDTPGFSTPGVCHNCASNASSCTSLIEYLSCAGDNNLQGFHCSRGGCSAAMHGRFEEVTYQADGSEQCMTEVPPVSSSLSDCLDVVSHSSTDSHPSKVEKIGLTLRDDRNMRTNSNLRPPIRKSASQLCCGSISGLCLDISEASYHQHLPDSIDDCDYENEIRQELRWLKAKYHMEKSKYQNQQDGRAKSSSHLSPSFDNEDHNIQDVLLRHSLPTPHPSGNELLVSSHLQDQSSFHFSQLKLSNASSESDINDRFYENGCSNIEFQRIRKCATNAVTNPDGLFATKSLHPSIHLSGYLPRTRSLPVDAVDT